VILIKGVVVVGLLIEFILQFSHQQPIDIDLGIIIGIGISTITSTSINILLHCAHYVE
jgi:hypothetical protein